MFVELLCSSGHALEQNAMHKVYWAFCIKPVESHDQTRNHALIDCNKNVGGLSIIACHYAFQTEMTDKRLQGNSPIASYFQRTSNFSVITV